MLNQKCRNHINLLSSCLFLRQRRFEPPILLEILYGLPAFAGSSVDVVRRMTARPDPTKVLHLLLTALNDKVFLSSVDLT